MDTNETPASPLDFVEAEIRSNLHRINGSRKFYRKNNFWVVVASATLSALTTVLIGVSQMFDWKALAALSLVTSACASVAAAWEGFFRNREMWVHKTDVARRLHDLARDAQYLRATAGDAVTADQIDVMYRSLCDVLRESHAEWMNIRRVSTARETDRSSDGQSP